MTATSRNMRRHHETGGTHVTTVPVEADGRPGSSHRPCVVECDECHVLLTSR